MLLGVPDYACVFSPVLPPGNWKPLGISAELTEEQAAELVEDYKGAFFYDYTLSCYIKKTAVSSFASLMQANAINEPRLILIKQ
jgi:hypothetical protein